MTCVHCKLLEHIACSNIMAPLNEYKLLSGRQHAFRKGHSCETQLTTVINDWAKILDNRGQVDTFILDFEKAFHTPPHELLKSKLFSYGIGGKTLKWIDSFLLCFRKQRVVVNGFVGCPPGHRSWSLVVLSVHKWHLISYWVWNKTFCWWLCLLSWNEGWRRHNKTSEGYWSIGFLGKEVGCEISTCQMQYHSDAADKKTDQEDPCFIYLRGNWPWKRWKH